MRCIYIKRAMKIRKELTRFMRICLDNQKMVESWQIYNIHISTSWLSFEVAGCRLKSILISIENNKYSIYINGFNIKVVSSPNKVFWILNNIFSDIVVG